MLPYATFVLVIIETLWDHNVKCVFLTVKNMFESHGIGPVSRDQSPTDWNPKDRAPSGSPWLTRSCSLLRRGREGLAEEATALVFGELEKWTDDDPTGPARCHVSGGRGRRRSPAKGPPSAPPAAGWAVREMINHLRHSGCVCCVIWVGAEEPLVLWLLGRLLQAHWAQPLPGRNRKPRVSGPTEPQQDALTWHGTSANPFPGGGQWLGPCAPSSWGEN